MTLLDTDIGKTYTVKELTLEVNTKRRLEALGITCGTRVAVLNHKADGSLIFKVRGTRLAVGSQIASSIILTEGK